MQKNNFMITKKQIFFVHGGEAFKNYTDYLDYLKTRPIALEKYRSWRNEYLSRKLGPYFDIISPQMPGKENAKYLEWKINFERYLPYLTDNLTLIGNSLGGIFLTKYLSENKFPKKIKALILVAPPYSNKLKGEYFAGGFKLGKDLTLITKNCPQVFLLFSEDDEVVPLDHAAKYAKNLPAAKLFVLKNKNGHFRISKFPEIVKLIKDCYNLSNL